MADNIIHICRIRPKNFHERPYLVSAAHCTNYQHQRLHKFSKTSLYLDNLWHSSQHGLQQLFLPVCQHFHVGSKGYELFNTNTNIIKYFIEIISLKLYPKLKKIYGTSSFALFGSFS